MSSVVKSIKVVKRSERAATDSPGLAKTERQLRREMTEIIASWIVERRDAANDLSCRGLLLLAEAESSN